MSLVSCPHCTGPAERGGWPLWVVVCCILLFPFGLLAILAGRRASTCLKCGFTWHE